MKTLAKSLIAAAVLAANLGIAAPALAATPALSVSKEGGSDSARITITGANPYSSITLYRRQSTQLWTVINNFGQTDQSGYFSQITNLGTDGSSNMVEQYVVVGGQQSNIVQIYPYGGGNVAGAYTGCSGEGCGGFNVSQSSLNLAVGQTMSITAYNTGGNNLFVSSNTSPGIASITISGNQINFYGLSGGSGNVTVCLSGALQCANIALNVSGASPSVLALSQTSVFLSVGQSASVYAVNLNSGVNLFVSQNINSSVVSASTFGQTLSLVGLAPGSSTVSVCTSISNVCSNVYVTVASSTASGLVWFSPISPTVNPGQSLAVSIFSSGNYSGTYYIASNSNQSAVAASISGATLNLTGNAPGSSSTIAVCQTNGSGCGSLYVQTSPAYTGAISLSQNNLSLNPGQSAAVTVLGSPYPSYYVASNSNPSAAVANFVGNAVNVHAKNSGSAVLSLCVSGSASCVSLNVSVSNFPSDSLYFLTNILPQPSVGVYYSQQLSVSGGSQPYSFSLQSGNLPSGLSLSSNGQIYGTPQNNQTATFSVRASDAQNRSAAISFTLSPSGGYTPPPPPPAVLGSSAYPNGQLISENGIVYIVYKGQTAGFASAAVFRALGYKFNNVVEVGFSNAPYSGHIINSARSSHPWGSWIKAGRTVYFVHESGLIPVPDWATFVNNGGDGRLIVPANSYDVSLPVLPQMEFSDYRLR